MAWFQAFGVIGLILIIFGVLIKKRRYQDEFYMSGGAFLLVYSSFMRDPVFITLQIIFILVAGYDFFKKKIQRIM